MTARLLPLVALALLLSGCAQERVPPAGPAGVARTPKATPAAAGDEARREKATPPEAQGAAGTRKATAPSPGVGTRTYTASDVEKALDDAEEFRSQGKYKQALERHIWFHENALRYAPAMRGVRLSFALSDWVDLARDYPKALDALKETRNKAVKSYRRNPSDRQPFEDAMSIDFAINDLSSAKSLFYEARTHGAVPFRTLSLELDRIIDVGQLSWAKDVIGDPDKALDQIKHERDAVRSRAGNKNTQWIDEVFSTQATKLIQAVAKVDGVLAARDLQKSALKYLDSPEIRSAIN